MKHTNTTNSSNTIRYILITLALLVLSTVHGKSISEADKALLFKDLSKQIEERYVYLDKVKGIQAKLEELRQSEIVAKVENAAQLATVISDELDKIDGHFNVTWEQPLEEVAIKTDSQTESWEKWSARTQFGFNSYRHLTGNISYLDLRYFSGSEEAMIFVNHYIQLMNNSEAVIIDLRQNRGGSPEMVQYLCSYFFSKKNSIHLNSLQYREGDKQETVEFWTHTDLPENYLTDKPLYVLTSSRSASAAEEFAYNMKTQKRATLVGETTMGVANPGGVIALSNGYQVFIPFGAAINPITKTNWEGVGVKPDISVNQADALDSAYQLALMEVKKRTENHFLAKEIDWKIEKNKALSSTARLNLEDKLEYVYEFADNRVYIDNGALYYQQGKRPQQQLIEIQKDVFGLIDSDGVRLVYQRNSKGQLVSIVVENVNGTERWYPLNAVA